MSKCAIMCINSENEEDHKPLKLQNLELKSTTCEVYLGSSITNSYKLADHVQADLRIRNTSIIKFFAFLRNNANAPVEVKVLVLEACVMSILHNAATWADTKIDCLAATKP